MHINLKKVVLAISSLALASLSCAAFSSLLGKSALLQDDFSDSNSGWGTKTDSNSSIEYSNGGLQMKVLKQNYFIWSTPNGEDYDKVHIETTVINNGTDPTTAFGIMCNQQVIDTSFYYFAVTPGGEYAIARAQTGLTDVFLSNNDQWATSDLIPQNASSYRVGADCGNGTLTLYVNGQQIASVSDSVHGPGGVGVFTWSGEEASSADVTIDDFVMTSLP
jgi:hypothetical protein